jgi:hypothetical protein
MQGSETVVVGTEAPAERTTFDPFGDAARRQGDDFDDLVQDRPSGDREPARRVARGDGLTMELDDSQDEFTASPPPKPRRRFDTAIERATDLALRLAGTAPLKRTYEKGQRVRHADYGEGVITGISGSGPRSVGIVIFDGPAGTRKFVLSHNALDVVAE